MFDDSCEDGCRRKWGFRYIDGIKPPPLQSAILGKHVHKELETFFKGGEIDYKKRPGKLAGKILTHLLIAVNLRNRFGGLEYVESKNVLWYDGVFYNFTIDLIYPEPDMIVVSDHKTSKDPEEYGVTSEGLHDDPQGIIYSFFPLELFDLPVVRLQWTYVRTQAPKPPKTARDSFPIRTEFTREEARKKIGRVHKIAQEIVHAKATYKKAIELPPNPKACGAFGGCPHAAYCTLTFEQKIQSVFQINTRKGNRMGLKDRLQQKRMAPPRPEQLQNWNPAQINSPEAPSPEVAQQVVETISQFKGNRNQTQENSLNVAVTAYGSQTPQEAAERLQSFQPQVTQMNPNFNPSENPTQQELVARVSAGMSNWTSVRNRATPQIPFVHGKTLNTAKEQGLLDFSREGQNYKIWIASGGQQAPMQYQAPPQQQQQYQQYQQYQQQEGGGQPQQYQQNPGMVPATSQGVYQPQPQQQWQQPPPTPYQPAQQPVASSQWKGAEWARPGASQTVQTVVDVTAPDVNLSREEFLSAFVQLVSAGLTGGISCEQAVSEADKAIEAIRQRLD